MSSIQYYYYYPMHKRNMKRAKEREEKEREEQGKSKEESRSRYSKIQSEFHEMVTVASIGNSLAAPQPQPSMSVHNVGTVNPKGERCPQCRFNLHNYMHRKNGKYLECPNCQAVIRNN